MCACIVGWKKRVSVCVYVNKRTSSRQSFVSLVYITTVLGCDDNSNIVVTYYDV